MIALKQILVPTDHLRTLVDESLTRDEEIVFDGQSHDEAIRMAYRDCETLEHPMRGQFTCHP